MVAATAGGEAAMVEAVTMAATAVGAGWLGLELPVGGGEDCLTLGLKLCPPRVLTTGLRMVWGGHFMLDAIFRYKVLKRLVA